MSDMVKMRMFMIFECLVFNLYAISRGEYSEYISYIYPHKPLQQEGEEVEECIELAIVTDILVAEFDAVADVVVIAS